LAAALARKRFRDLEALHRRVMHEQTADLEELNRQLAQRVTELEQRERRSPPGAGDAPRRYRDAAVVCCALGAFATAASEIDATVAFEILADFASAVRDLARRYGAVAEGTFADATLVVFPDPSCAMRVSPAIEETLAPVVIQAHERHQVEINWVAGVARGDVLAGTVVVDGRERQLVVGPAVELAVAVCHEAPAGRVVFDCEAQPA
jgi:class 3 adenylate cyclase